MGQGSHILIQNRTDQDWICFHNHKYQMDGWKFPKKIEAGTEVRVYVEFCEGVFKDEHDDGGEVKYRFASDTDETPSRYIEFAATFKHDRDVYVKLVDVPSKPEALNKTIDLGWRHDGSMPFALYGSKGNYFPIDPGNWMQATMDAIGEYTLKEIAIPGSHDAGMYKRNGHTLFGEDCNTLTQTLSIGGQLANGSRYFDIRPVISGDQYYTGHYTKAIKMTWQGANGESVSDIIKEVNEFTSKRKELIILNLSHDYNADVGNASYRHFNEEEWTGLFGQLSKINGLLHSEANDLTHVKLNDLLADGSKVIVVTEKLDKSQLGKYYRKGFFTSSEFNVYNKYADTNSVSQMMADQIKKMKEHRAAYFLLSWTLTQSHREAATCFLFPSDSILDLAKTANANLYRAFDEISGSLYPNIVYIDKFDSPLALSLVLYINALVCDN
ncbi:hypothetical protein SAMN02927921_00437 [Sinomicrobium oceani]|uniref:1-phosphatidylinositol phosphodiesterase n=2 Tax=Sinomicrobium oceani TaxID=1150368 RepID=A0A1K1M6Y9_9FLAO|nr:hypothetical protein SAMN02927921_00437 [Sinomicrobium oceani]